MPRNPVAAIIGYNRRFVGRYDVLLQRKVENLARSPFKFFRGTFHLFAQDYAERLIAAPPTPLPADGALAIVGDIHGENYGTYKAADGTLRYDINDFDETTAAQLNFDCRRAATGLVLAGRDISLAEPKILAAVQGFAESYWDQLRANLKQDPDKFEEISDRHPPEAAVAKTLLANAVAAKRKEVLDQILKGGADGGSFARNGKFFDLKPADNERARRLLAEYFARLTGPKAKELASAKTLDVAGRVAGCGSLGRYRFVVLLAVADAADKRPIVLEIKESLPSACDDRSATHEAKAAHGKSAAKPDAGHAGLGRAGGVDRATLRARAAEVCAVERAMQPASNAYLGYAVDDGGSFQVRELGPHDARLEWKDVQHEHEFGDIAALHARILANAHIRCAASDPARRKLADATPLDGKDRRSSFVTDLMQFAQAYAGIVASDHAMFREKATEVSLALGLDAGK